jgi:hypothetical protein
MPRVSEYVTDLLSEPIYGNDYMKKLPQRIQEMNAQQLNGMYVHLKKTHDESNFHMWKKCNEKIMVEMKPLLDERMAVVKKREKKELEEEFLERQRWMKNKSKKVEFLKVKKFIEESSRKAAVIEVNDAEQVRLVKEKLEIVRKSIIGEAKKETILKNGGIFTIIMVLIAIGIGLVLLKDVIFFLIIMGTTIFIDIILAIRGWSVSTIYPMKMTHEMLEEETGRVEARLQEEARAEMQRKEEEYKAGLKIEKMEKKKRKEERFKKAREDQARMEERRLEDERMVNEIAKQRLEKAMNTDFSSKSSVKVNVGSSSNTIATDTIDGQSITGLSVAGTISSSNSIAGDTIKENDEFQELIDTIDKIDNSNQQQNVSDDLKKLEIEINENKKKMEKLEVEMNETKENIESNDDSDSSASDGEDGMYDVSKSLDEVSEKLFNNTFSVIADNGNNSNNNSINSGDVPVRKPSFSSMNDLNYLESGFSDLSESSVGIPNNISNNKFNDKFNSNSNDNSIFNKSNNSNINDTNKPIPIRQGSFSELSELENGLNTNSSKKEKVSIFN